MQRSGVGLSPKSSAHTFPKSHPAPELTRSPKIHSKVEQEARPLPQQGARRPEIFRQPFEALLKAGEYLNRNSFGFTQLLAGGVGAVGALVSSGVQGLLGVPRNERGTRAMLHGITVGQMAVPLGMLLDAVTLPAGILYRAVTR